MNSTITGAQFPGNLVHQGKMEEIRWVKEIGLYKKVSRAEAKRRGIAVVPIKWAVTDKGRKQTKSEMQTCGERVAREDKLNLACA